MTGARRVARAGFERVESWFDQVFGSAWNPLYQLGALGWFFFWIVVVSGVYLYIFFDSGVTQAYESLEYLTHEQWYAGGVMRSLHRYASDALVIVIMLHLLREFVMDRLRGARWFGWFTGVPLIWLVFAAGISGYWVVWDKLAQYVAVVTTEWLDALPLFGEPIARNFLHATTLSGRFFTLMVFIHIAVPLILLFLMWIHIQRYAQPRVNPPRGLAVGTLAMLLILSFAYPAVSQEPADLNQVPAVVGLDWFYLALYPLLDSFSGLAVWALVGGGTLLLLLLPWLPPKRRNPVAQVSLENCNGCRRCYDDCPFSAISMSPRTDGAAFEQEALVNADKCVGCGICVGACPTSTPYRRRAELVSGIELPNLMVKEIREKTLEVAAPLTGNDRVIVYGCEPGSALEQIAGSGVATVRLNCVAMLPPSFIDFVLSRKLADGVFLTGCRPGACFDRLGIQWTEQRIAGARDPYLRKRVPPERVGKFWGGVADPAKLGAELEAFRARLRTLGTMEKVSANPVAHPAKADA